MSTSWIRMSRHARAIGRTKAIARHMMSTSAPTEELVAFESNLAVRTFILNRPRKLNALSEPMLNALRPKIEQWSKSDICEMIVAQGAGRAFCAGGDVAGVVLAAAEPETRAKAIDFFKREYELDYILAAMDKPYVAIMDGITMGGGVGLAAPADFRVATEKTVFAMPETKIGYFPDVGASYYMSKMDGELGTYFAMTGETIQGRDLYELGFATHYITSSRVPKLLEQLNSLESAAIHHSVINDTIETFTAEREQDEDKKHIFTGPLRVALDYAFRHNRVDEIIQDLHQMAEDEEVIPEISEWATKTLATLRERSPTSLVVALEAIRRASSMSILDVLNMEMKIAYAYCNQASGDFSTGVHAVLIDKKKEPPTWSPATLEDVTDDVIDKFFAPNSEYLRDAPSLEIPQHLQKTDPSRIPTPMKWALPTELEITRMVRGADEGSAGTALTKKEVVDRFHKQRQGKLGVREKVSEAVDRLCDVVDNEDDGNAVWLVLKPAISGESDEWYEE